jgi:hypothetical protein
LITPWAAVAASAIAKVEHGNAREQTALLAPLLATHVVLDAARAEPAAHRVKIRIGTSFMKLSFVKWI